MGAGGALDASKKARGIPSPGSAKLADFPALALLGDTATLFTIPALIAALFAAATGGRTERLLAAGAAGWVAIVALMTTAGYAGNPRYLVAAAAVGASLAGVGAVRAATLAWTASPALPRRTGACALTRSARWCSSPPCSPSPSATCASQSRELSSRAAAAGAFDGVLARAGGRDALVRCSRIRTSTRARSLVAWRLDLPLRDLDARPSRPAVVIRAQWFYGQGLEPPREPGYRTLVTAPYWQIVEACGPAPQLGK